MTPSFPSGAFNAGGPPERLTLTGRLDPRSFLPWIARHAGKLGLDHAVIEAGPTRIALSVRGHADLVDMLAIGCSLGPVGVWVEAVERGSEAGWPREGDTQP